MKNCRCQIDRYFFSNLWQDRFGGKVRSLFFVVGERKWERPTRIFSRFSCVLGNILEFRKSRLHFFIFPRLSCIFGAGYYTVRRRGGHTHTLDRSSNLFLCTFEFSRLLFREARSSNRLPCGCRFPPPFSGVRVGPTRYSGGRAWLGKLARETLVGVPGGGKRRQEEGGGASEQRYAFLVLYFAAYLVYSFLLQTLRKIVFLFWVGERKASYSCFF